MVRMLPRGTIGSFKRLDDDYSRLRLRYHGNYLGAWLQKASYGKYDLLVVAHRYKAVADHGLTAYCAWRGRFRDVGNEAEGRLHGAVLAAVEELGMFMAPHAITREFAKTGFPIREIETMESDDLGAIERWALAMSP
jgi:hypothetical protein